MHSASPLRQILRTASPSSATRSLRPCLVARLLCPTALGRPSLHILANARQSARPRTTLRAYSASSSAAASAEPTSSASVPSVPTVPKPEHLDAAEAEIWDRLSAEFAPAELVVQDISGGCGSMYGIEIVSEAFRDQNMLKQQRMVNAVLADLMKGWHGVQLKTRTPS